MRRHLLIWWMGILSWLVHLSVPKLLLMARKRGFSSFPFLVFIFIEINIAKTWLHKYVDENGRSFVIVMPNKSLDAFWVIFEKSSSHLWKLFFYALSARNSIESSNFVKQIIGNHLTCKKYLLSTQIAKKPY